MNTAKRSGNDYVNFQVPYNGVSHKITFHVGTGRVLMVQTIYMNTAPAAARSRVLRIEGPTGKAVEKIARPLFDAWKKENVK